MTFSHEIKRFLDLLSFMPSLESVTSALVNDYFSFEKPTKSTLWHINQSDSMICLADFGSGEPFTGKSFPGTVWRVNSLAMPLALHATSKNPVTWSYENTHAVVNLYAKNMLVGFWMLELTAAPKNLTEFNAKLEEFSWPLSLYIALGFLDSADFNDEAKRNKSSSPLSTESEGLDLTLRQLSILRGISQMKTNHQIAIEYGLSVSTVRHETKEIFDILGVVGRIEAANEARKLGIT